MEVVRADPDGHTIMFASNSAVASNVALLTNIPYDPNKDFTPIVGTGVNALVLMVKPDSPAKNLKEFIEYVKQRPGKLNAGYGRPEEHTSETQSLIRISYALFCLNKKHHTTHTTS